MTHRPHLPAQWIRTTTAAGLLPLLLASLPACATRSTRAAMPAVSQPAARAPWWSAEPLTWARVEAVPVGTRTEVQLYDDEALPDSRRVTGRFHAAMADTLTLMLDERRMITRTLEKSAVRTVHVRRPIRNRYAGWLTLVGGTLGLAVFFAEPVFDFVPWAPFMFGAIFAAPASLIGFVVQRRQLIYDVPPAAARLITQVEVPVTDGDVIPRSREITVSVFHAIPAGRPLSETIGLTVCLSSHPARCTGRWEIFDGPVGHLSSPLTATLRFSDETVSVDTPVSIYVHVVLMTGSPWRPAPGQAVPQLGDPGVLDVETVTRRITVVDR